ncbi:MAG: hypothetical protein QM698_11860 [Micropepsaceae bacterium]
MLDLAGAAGVHGEQKRAVLAVIGFDLVDLAARTRRGGSAQHVQRGGADRGGGDFPRPRRAGNAERVAARREHHAPHFRNAGFLVALNAGDLVALGAEEVQIVERLARRGDLPELERGLGLKREMLAVVVAELHARHALFGRRDALGLDALVRLALLARLPVGLALEGEGDVDGLDAVFEIGVDAEIVAAGAKDVIVETLFGVAAVALFQRVVALVHPGELDGRARDIAENGAETDGGVGVGNVENVETGARIAVLAARERDRVGTADADRLGPFDGVVDPGRVLAARRGHGEGRDEKNHSQTHEGHESVPKTCAPVLARGGDAETCDKSR